MAKAWLLGSLLLVAPAICVAGSEPAGAMDAKAAFERLKTLVGRWEAKTEMGKVTLTYELIANGSALVERDAFENMPAMETVYHLDGNRLLLTHYCMLGNQPRMQARSFDPATGEIRFEFLDITNLASPGAAHMHNVTLRIADADHLTGEWQGFENGALKSTDKAQFTRVKADDADVSDQIDPEVGN